jgi:exodeoxyribonuclease V gamma subunit
VIRLHYSNRLEQLIAPLAEAVARQQDNCPLDPVVIVVPSRVIEQFVRLRLSEALGVAANLRFPFLRRFLAETVESSAPEIKVLDLDEIHLALFEAIRRRLHDGTLPTAVAGYVDADRASDGARELRAFHLARRVAWLFREYSITRRAMVAGWHSGRLATAAEAERWQRDLWLTILDERGRLRAEWSADREHQPMLLPDAFDAVANDALRKALGAPLHVFGLAYAGPAYARMFARIGGLTDLNIYALNPCLEFWEDVDNPAGIERQSWIHRRDRVGAALESSEDPFALDVIGDTPALRLWGRPGREYIRLLNELTECDFDPHFAYPAADSHSLLSRVQEDILRREPERAPRTAGDSMPDDGSIRLLACPGVRRECEIVANEIWSVIRSDDRGARRLRFHEIAVMVPDSLYDAYLPHIETVFDRLHRIPADLLNRGFASESRVSEAVALLLRLPLGRFSRDEMLHLLTHPALAGEHAEIDAAVAREWCEELGIFFGAGADAAHGYLPRGAFHWDQALKRLALGVFMDGGREARFFEAPDNLDYLPYATAQDETPVVASFVRTARSLLADAMEIRARTLTLPEWSRLLSGLILTYIRTSTPADERIRDQCVAAVEGIATAEINSQPVSYEVAFETASSGIAGARSRQGQFSERGVAVGPLSALRAIPFRVAFLMGLNESDFPERTRREPIDLRLVGRKAGDVTPAERDRYLFLETLGAARDRIYLSYLARDAQTGDRLEPSSVIRELQFILRGYLDEPTLSRLCVEHPVSRYDLRYFPELPQPPSPAGVAVSSFDSAAHHGARMAALRADLAAHCGDGPLPGRDEPLLERLAPAVRSTMHDQLRLLDLPGTPMASESADELWLPLSALRRFLECPLQGAARYALGIYEEEDDAGETGEDEPIAQSVLDRTILLRQVFWNARGDRERLAREYEEAVRVALAHGHAPAGPFAAKAMEADLARMREWLDQAKQDGIHALDEWLDVRLGRADEFKDADKILPEISVPIAITDGSGRARIIKIHGAAGFFSSKLEHSIQCILRDKLKPKDFLGMALGAIALAAAGENCGKLFGAHVLCAATDKPLTRIRSFKMPSRDEAIEYLQNLLIDMLCKPNHVFLPIEAVTELMEIVDTQDKKSDADLIDIVESFRDNDYASCASDYGPIRGARRFAAPSGGEIRDLIHRRFTPIRAIFGLAG